MNSNLIIFHSDVSLRILLRRECRGFNDTVMIESPFKETTRDGKDILRFVRLAVTSKTLVIASRKDQTTSSKSNSQFCEGNSQELLQMYPWQSVKLLVFKKSCRKCIKALFHDKAVRYFELQEIPKMKIHWHLWCLYIIELYNSTKIWPFVDMSSKYHKKNKWEYNCVEISVLKHKKKIYTRPKWTDKYLCLGSIREVEDQIRPMPVPGLGKAEEIKLLYLKPRYFGCWEQSEHWVQCEESSPEFMPDYDKKYKMKYCLCDL